MIAHTGDAPPDKPPSATGSGRPDAPLRSRRVSLSGVRVLAVDDDDDAREVLGFLLEGVGADVTTAASAADAFELAKSKRFDIVISDIGMPDRDGYELIMDIRSLPSGAGGTTPAIALTAFAREEDRMRALRAGYQRHLAKPVDASALLDTIKRLVEPGPESA